MNKAGSDQRESGAEITASAVALADTWGPCTAQAKVSLCLVNTCLAGCSEGPPPNCRTGHLLPPL